MQGSGACEGILWVSFGALEEVLSPAPTRGIESSQSRLFLWAGAAFAASGKLKREEGKASHGLGGAGWWGSCRAMLQMYYGGSLERPEGGSSNPIRRQDPSVYLPPNGVPRLDTDLLGLGAGLHAHSRQPLAKLVDVHSPILVGV